MSDYRWTENFGKAYDAALAFYRKGGRDADACVDGAGKAFLASVGQEPWEIFDFVEDAVNDGEPDFGTVLLVAAVRRRYFLAVQRGEPSARRLDPKAIPGKGAEAEGIPWLPRIIAKARAKLRGELPPGLMYGCGGDRAFLRPRDIHPADFLRLVWEAGEETGRIVRFVREREARGR